MIISNNGGWKGRVLDELRFFKSHPFFVIDCEIESVASLQEMLPHFHEVAVSFLYSNRVSLSLLMALYTDIVIDKY